MKHVFRPGSLSLVDVQLQKNHLLHIADLDPEGMPEGCVLRAELRNMLNVARALAMLVELLFLQVWDRTFQIVGTRVFMHFSSDDLLATGRPPVTDVLEVLKTFLAWRDARLTLCVPAMDVNQPAIESPINDDAIEIARRKLAMLRGIRAGESDTNFDDIFLCWMQRCARVDEFAIMAGTVDGDVVRLQLPHKARILRPLSLPPQRCSTPTDHAHDIVAVRRLWLVRTTSGTQLLIPCGEQHEAPSPGTAIAYKKRDRRLVKRWQILR